MWGDRRGDGGKFAHVPALLEHPGADLVVGQSRELEIARAVARHFGIAGSASSAEQLMDCGLDAVVVSSSPYLHYEQARGHSSAGCTCYDPGR